MRHSNFWGCSVPRGAALSAEVLREKDAKEPTFTVVPVNRANVDRLAGWPVTGWRGGYNWISAKRGPSSAVINTGDTVNLVIWDSQDNSLLADVSSKTALLPPAEVSSAGTIFVPYLGDVVVNGQTAEAARAQIQSAMEPIAPSAQVQLSVTAGVRNSVDLVSGVGNPGSYPLPDRNYSILSLLAAGGGISPTFKNPLVRWIRAGKTYEIRADRLLAEASKNTTLRGGDKVIVAEDDRYFTALGATGTESLIRFEKDNISALEAMSLVGGISDARANPKGVLVLREYPAKAVRADGIKGPEMRHVVFTFDLTSADGLFAARNFQINPKDSVLATESSLTAANTIFGLIGSLVGLNNSVK
ncbi:polysaccharide export protein [Pseudorhodobacter turbinis]|uniref:Polysaccharide export protein n=1 Tax=Pseudorhodobacter turbinis TaxID=2500533 RepID=A0A4P8EDU5_9RHOB|nr:polysaccharide export protein [Pseudorhodobacter turbinis]